MEQVLIIGNGISGVTAARHIRKRSNKKITIVSSESKYFFSRTALMYVYMGHMKFEHTQPYEDWFWEKNRIELVEGLVFEIKPENNKVVLSDGKELLYTDLIIATGSKSNKFGWPGQNAKGVVSLYNKQDLELIEEYAPNNKQCEKAVVVGGGLIGIELAEMLTSRNISVTMLVRESSFWNIVLPEEESSIINAHIKKHHIDLKLSSNLEEIKTDKEGNVEGVVIQETGELIPCNLVGLTVGVSPNIDFLANSTIDTSKGILVNKYLETNYNNIYAIGDCAEQTEPVLGHRSIEAVWYTGRMMGETVAASICGEKTAYQPGHWFNSAKFFDIEYQTYGLVPAKKLDNEARFFWKHPEKEICIHINFDKNNYQFIGINMLGIRMKHEFFDDALKNNVSVDKVVMNLRSANFDPEFYRRYEADFIEKFNSKFNLNIALKKKIWNMSFRKSNKAL